MRQGVTLPETPRDRTQRDALEEDMLGNPLSGEPLRRRLRNFRPDASAQLAALGGPLAWMRRLRAIETVTALYEQELGRGAGRTPGGHSGRPGAVRRRVANNWPRHGTSTTSTS